MSSLLNRADQERLNDLFAPKVAFGKSLIYIGIHELKCTKVEWRATRNGSKMLYFELWKKPEYTYYSRKEKVPFAKMKFFHIPSISDSVPFSPNDWFRYTFTSNISNEFLTMLHAKLLQKPVFKAIIGQEEKPVTIQGLTGEYTKLYWNNFIHSVYRIDEEVSMTNDLYFELYKPYYEKTYDKELLEKEEDECPF